MTFTTRSGRRVPTHLQAAAAEARAARCAVTRREFLATASSFGVATATAYAMLGLSAPRAAAATPRMGGTVRMQNQLRALKDPRSFDFNAMANFTRGWLEYLVQYEPDGTFTPILLEGWEISDDATRYTLNVRKGVTWNTGEAFTAEDVAFNIARFCDRTAEGNAMASKFAVMIDPETDRAMTGAIEVLDSHTVQLNLPAPDISLIAGLSDYPAAIVPQGFSADTMLSNPVGTGPYLPVEYEVGGRCVLERNPDHTWWNAGNGAWMDRVETIDYGGERAAIYAAAEADEIDMLYDTIGEYVTLFDELAGWTRHEAVTAATILARCNQAAEVDGATPYSDVRVRRALQMAVDNAVVLEIAASGQGMVAENHHVCPIHPEYAELPPPVHDPEAGRALMEEAGMAEFEHELVSLDTGFWKDTADVIGAQIRDAGIPLRRKVYPTSTFWNDWAKYPFSVTNWNHRPLGIQTLAIAYRSGEPWNETGYANPEFDALVSEALATPDVAARRAMTERLQRMMQEDGVIIQPYWRKLYNHTKATLKGGEIHPQQEVRPAALYWEA